MLATSLWITLLGMGIVFGTILALWGLMIALNSILGKEQSHTPSTKRLVPIHEHEAMAKAAALAVVVALAEQGLSTARPLATPPTAIISAWQLGMRTRQMYQKGERVKTERRDLPGLKRGNKR